MPLNNDLLRLTDELLLGVRSEINVLRLVDELMKYSSLLSVAMQRIAALEQTLYPQEQPDDRSGAAQTE
jgi:hypothetical protein